MQAARIEIPFYTEKISLEYNPIMLNFKKKVRLGYANIHTGKLQIQDYYEDMRRQGGYLTLLNELRRAKKQYRLNDWLFYRLTNESIEKIAPHKTKLERVLLRWYMLNAAGFDCRITYFQERAYLNIYTEDKLFEIPMIEEDGKYFANMSSEEYEGNAKSNLYIVSYVANPGGRAFKFDLNKLPAFREAPQKEEITWYVDDKEYTIEASYDRNIVNLMKDYPYLADDKYFKVPLSQTAYRDLIPKFRSLIAGKTQVEALRTLAVFTRSAFAYQLDEEYFGRSRPMVAEELFAYPYSDCEDRCALFFTLCKNLLDLPMIVLSFDDHISLAVAAEGFHEGDYILHKGKNFFVCDPTGPSNSDTIGFFPKGYESKPFEIILDYLP